MVTRVLVSPSIGSNSKVVLVVPVSPVVAVPAHSMTIRCVERYGLIHVVFLSRV
jgi:hypothetical protein